MANRGVGRTEHCWAVLLLPLPRLRGGDTQSRELMMANHGLVGQSIAGQSSCPPCPVSEEETCKARS